MTSNMPDPSSRSSKKYKLYTLNGTEPDKKPPCAFYATEAGCRNGSKCTFSHGNPTADTSFRNVSSDSSSSSSAVSSESEGDRIEEDSAPLRDLVQENKCVSTRKRHASEFGKEQSLADTESPFAFPRRQDQCQSHSQGCATDHREKSGGTKKNKKDTSKKGSPSLGAAQLNEETVHLPCKDAIANEDVSHDRVLKKRKNNKKAVTPPHTPCVDGGGTAGHDGSPFLAPRTHSGYFNTSSNSTGLALEANNFRSLVKHLPVASFAAKDGEIIDETEAGRNGGNKEFAEECMASAHLPSMNAKVMDKPLPKFSVEGMAWNSQIAQTRKHPRYIDAFDFAKAKGGESSSAAWMQTLPFGPWCATNPQVLCIDCEMCETCNPVTGEIDPKALCRISVVNGTNPEEVLLDTLVQPEWPVKDYRARINGISAAHLAGVKFTINHAHEFMRSLCSEETVLVGHALHNDLIALKMEHHCVVDTSLLFPVTDADNMNGQIVPSLKDLAKCVLGKAMPKIHDSVNDARTSLLCAVHYKEKKGKVDPIVRTMKPNAGHKLFVHRLPMTVKAEHLSAMFLQHTSIMPALVDQIEFGATSGKTHVTFKSIGHANLAFECLDGKPEHDKAGMLQKKIFLKNRDYIRVRKTVLSKNASLHAKKEK